MKQRCNGTTKLRDRERYRDRGIRVCRRWRESFLAFRKWALRSGYKAGLSIDRKDNDKGYYPANCRWTNNSVQAMNTGKRRFFRGRKTTSPYRGVCLKHNRWIAQIKRPDGKQEHIGSFDSEVQAATAYDEKCLEYYGGSVTTNFPKEMGVSVKK